MAAGNALSPLVPVYTSAYQPQRDYTSERDAIVYSVFKFQRHAYEVDASGPIIFTGPRSPARVRQSPAESGGLNRTLTGLVPYITKIGNFFIQHHRPFLADYKSEKIM